MAFKVVLVLFLTMLLFTQNNATDFEQCYKLCIMSCPGNIPFGCAAACNLSCILQDNPVTIEKRVCSVGCSLGHCNKFLINKSDKSKFESCMKSCGENYCIGGNNTLKKA
ncbi:uncharacterized protein LOC129876678 [Solanum dulcamara]|uniref:uncharacterized protein LOC129876678 n=1 Tax=Solanum dulcamara TaxID=45834 RepID=UPI00248597A9|nr:uncharacterized protein LOC129876678 [Solanum dulcamara]